MNEREAKALAEVFEGILIRHVGDDKNIVASTLIDMVVKAFDDTEGGIIQ